jgi:chemotaxis protein CheC
MDRFKATAEQLDALREMGNIGAGHAATSLSNRIHKKIMIDVCKADVVNIKDISRILNDKNGDILDVRLFFSGDINGSIHYLMFSDEALGFVDILAPRPRSETRELNDVDLKAIQECGAGLLTSYLKAMGDLLKASLVFAEVEIERIPRTDFISHSLLNRHAKDEVVFCVEIKFVESKNSVKGYFFLIPDRHGFEFIIKHSGMT